MGRGQGHGSQARTSGPRGMSTPLYHELSMQIRRICRVRFHTYICCLMHHVHYYIFCDRFRLRG